MSNITEQLQAIVDRANVSTERHYAWVRQMLTLCTGSLTVLVALHKSFVPESPRCHWLLYITWIGLGVSITIGATILHGEAVHLRDGVRTEMDAFLKRLETGENKVRVRATAGPRHYDIANRLFLWCLAVSLVSLVCFALFNI